MRIFIFGITISCIINTSKINYTGGVQNERRKNESGRSAKESVPDLRDLIQFDIEEENF